MGEKCFLRDGANLYLNYGIMSVTVAPAFHVCSCGHIFFLMFSHPCSHKSREMLRCISLLTYNLIDFRHLANLRGNKLTLQKLQKKLVFNIFSKIFLRLLFFSIFRITDDKIFPFVIFSITLYKILVLDIFRVTHNMVSGIFSIHVVRFMHFNRVEKFHPFIILL